MLLETKRLLLREMNPEDFDALFRVLGVSEYGLSSLVLLLQIHK